MASSYKYTQLSPSAIRLFRLTNVTDAIISAHLQAFSIIEAPPYVALSYRWGATKRDRPVFADEKDLLITSSLEAFLTELGRRQATGLPASWFWIDAVCINQDDVVERSQQVRRMKEVYEGAQAIVIWLGEGDGGTDDAMETLEELAALDCSAISIRDGDIPGTTCKIGDENYVEVLYSTLTFDIGGLLNLEYWNRCWIIQEASTPISKLSIGTADIDGTVVWCGGASIEWDMFCEANRRLIDASWNNHVAEYAPMHGVANEDITTLSRLYGQRKLGDNTEALYLMMVRSRTSSATDPRDKLYSVLGLAKGAPPNLQPDYSKPVEEVYLDLARELISATSSLDCLGSASFVESNTLPSFAPDWRLQHSMIPQPFYQTDRTHNTDRSISQEHNLFKADAGLPPRIGFTFGGRRLVARGFVFDIVGKLSAPRMRSETDGDVYEIWKTWTAVANPMDANYPSGSSRFEALARTLKADFEDVWGDWSSARGSPIRSFAYPFENAFEIKDPIIDAMTFNRRLFETHRGYLGLGAFTVEQDDKVCILFGSQMPIVLRAVDEHWVFIGQAYVHGIMDGEALEDFHEEKATDFEIR